jgi:uncharacterized repeat protein (TIGR02543 family)
VKKFISKISLVSFVVLVVLLLTTFILPHTSVQAAESDPKCWGVFVGVSDYATINDLQYCDDDARDFYNAFSPVWGKPYTKLLLDTEATKSAILDAINWMADNADVDDTVTFTFSGHGSDFGVYCPYDYHSVSSGISNVELSLALDAVKAEKIVVILDICFAGTFELTLSKNGRVLMLACRSDEYSEERDELQNGIYSYYLLQAISKWDDVDTNEDYELSAEEIAEYAYDYINNFIGSQHPFSIDDFLGELALIAKFVFVGDTALPAGTIVLTLDGVNYTSPPQTLFWIPGTMHTIAVPEEVSVASGTRYRFIGWDDGETSPARTISRGLYGANYNLEHLLNIISAYGDPAGAGWLVDGSLVTLSITPYIELPDTRHIFTGWSGDYTGTSPAASFYLNSPKTITANWRTEYLLTLNSEYGTPAGAGWHNEGESVTVSVEPVQGFLVRQIFDGWTGDLTGTAPDASVSMDSPRTITAAWHTDYVQLFILIAVILVIAGIVITIILVRRKGTKYPIPPAS